MMRRHAMRRASMSRRAMSPELPSSRGGVTVRVNVTDALVYEPMVSEASACYTYCAGRRGP